MTTGGPKLPKPKQDPPHHSSTTKLWKEGEEGLCGSNESRKSMRAEMSVPSTVSGQPQATLATAPHALSRGEALEKPWRTLY